MGQSMSDSRRVELWRLLVHEAAAECGNQCAALSGCLLLGHAAATLCGFLCRSEMVTEVGLKH